MGVDMRINKKCVAQTDVKTNNIECASRVSEHYMSNRFPQISASTHKIALNKKQFCQDLSFFSFLPSRDGNEQRDPQIFYLRRKNNTMNNRLARSKHQTYSLIYLIQLIDKEQNSFASLRRRTDSKMTKAVEITLLFLANDCENELNKLEKTLPRSYQFQSNGEVLPKGRFSVFIFCLDYRELFRR